VSQFNDGLYDIIVAADERSLDDPKSVNTDSSTNKHKLVHRLAVSLPKWIPLKWIPLKWISFVWSHLVTM